MTTENGQMLNRAAMEHQLSGQLGGATVDDTSKCAAPPSLRQRIRGQRYSAESEVERCSKLQELDYLLDKNPEVARILELLESVR